MTGELLEEFGSILALIGVFLSIIVTAAILVEVGAPLWAWLIYIVQLFMFIGTVMNTMGENL